MIVSEDNISFTFTLDKRTIEIFSELNIYLDLFPGQSHMAADSIAHCSKSALIEPFCCFNAAAAFHTMGFASYTNSTWRIESSIGRYCSIAGGIVTMNDYHPLDRVSSHPFTYQNHITPVVGPWEAAGNKDPYIPIYFAQPPFVTVQNDVWIGQDVCLARGITLHNGCAVAAGSLVTKDVPPYAIVGGNPAKIIRYRFDERIIERLLDLQWWRFSFSDFKQLDFLNPDKFCDSLEALIERDEITPYSPQKYNLYQILKE